MGTNEAVGDRFPALIELPGHVVGDDDISVLPPNGNFALANIFAVYAGVVAEGSGLE